MFKRNQLCGLVLVMAFSLAAPSHADATSVESFRKLSKTEQYQFFKDSVEARVGQIRERDPALAKEVEDYCLKSKSSEEDATGYQDFKDMLYVIEHPEINHGEFDPKTAQVEGVVVALIKTAFGPKLAKLAR